MQSGSTGSHPRWTGETLLQFLPGVGPARAELLKRLELATVRDLLRHFPRRYEDRRCLVPAGAAQPGQTVVVAGVLDRWQARDLGGGRHMLRGVLRDATGSMELVWFNQPYIAEWVRPGDFLHAYGTVKQRARRLQIVAPEFEVDTGTDDLEGEPSLHLRRIVPIYDLTRGLHQRFLRRLVHRCLEADLEWEPAPHDLFHPAGPSLADAFRAIHFPPRMEDAEAARKRFVFDEFFLFASRLRFRRQTFRAEGRLRFETTAELDCKIRSIFPFELTAEQNRVVEEIVCDLRGPAPMYRLLQGDVGTGKTAIALYAMLVAIRSGCQAALMAPTEVLVEQHLRTVAGCLRDHPVRVERITGSLPASRRRSILSDLAAGRIHIAIGTHALMQDSVRFRRLGLAVVDEQHRFGVRERQRLRLKGEQPHLLVMTATPIPRSLCLTCYGDLDLSLLRQRPCGRLPVATRLVSSAQRSSALEFVRAQVRKGRQAYFVYPLIEESESLSLPAAVEGHRRLSTEVFPEFSVGLIHGKLPPGEKEEQLGRFREARCQILVATVVVEVGIDVPNATVLVIEDASRFGLAQLHQLRGRVGRGAHRGYCLVGAGEARGEVLRRLRAFARISDGFELAEADLQIRGPGDYLGLRQSGRPSRSLGHPLEDLEEFLTVRRLADEFWASAEHLAYRSRWGLQESDGGEEEFLGLD
ncbi:MAG: ATP-dependent DNA helicase RecG [Planctomycetes bacterium]|nr:ATP-dependent DNA helicase RecG [Planctomycetota bacterium]